MSTLCCLCLTEPNGFTIIEDENDEINQQIQSCLQLKINFDTVKTAKICNSCLSQLEQAHGFFTRIHKTQFPQNMKMPLGVSSCKQEIKQLPIGQENVTLNNNCMESLEIDELDIKEEFLEEDENGSFNEENFRYDSDNSDVYVEETDQINALATIRNWKSYPWYCYQCIYSTLNFNTLMGHIKSKHDISSSKKMQFQCVDCTKKINSYSNFLNHVRLEHQPGLKLCCDVCSEVLNDYEQLAEHRKQHSNQSEIQQPIVYHCNHCSRVFSNRIAINKHVLTHEQGLKCQVCEKSFKRLKYLKRHMEMHATLKHKCDFCDKTFHRKFNKINHERTHTGERPYKCDHCEMKFSFQSTLKSHQRTHTGELPYKCKRCTAKFRHSDSLKEHMRKHTKEALVTCSICDATFQYRRSLNRHMQNIHNAIKSKNTVKQQTKTKTSTAKQKKSAKSTAVKKTI